MRQRKIFSLAMIAASTFQLWGCIPKAAPPVPVAPVAASSAVDHDAELAKELAENERIAQQRARIPAPVPAKPVATPALVLVPKAPKVKLKRRAPAMKQDAGELSDAEWARASMENAKAAEASGERLTVFRTATQGPALTFVKDQDQDQYEDDAASARGSIGTPHYHDHFRKQRSHTYSSVRRSHHKKH